MNVARVAKASNAVLNLVSPPIDNLVLLAAASVVTLTLSTDMHRRGLS